MQWLSENQVLVIICLGALIAGFTAWRLLHELAAIAAHPPPPKYRWLTHVIPVTLPMGDIFRSSRPRSIEDLHYFWSKGIRTIISLEEGWGKCFGWESEESSWRAMGGSFKQIRLSSVFPPTEDELESVNKLIIVAARNGNVLFHCYSGVDRTGFLAAYLMVKLRDTSPAIAWEQYCVDMGMHLRYRWFWKNDFLKIFAR